MNNGNREVGRKNWTRGRKVGRENWIEIQVAIGRENVGHEME